MRRRGGCGHGSEDAAVAHSCLPQAPPISAPAPVTDARGGNRAGKTRGERGASPEGPHWGWHLLGKAGGGTGRGRGGSTAPSEAPGRAGRMLTVPASRSRGAGSSAGSRQYWGFSVPRSTARRRGYTGYAWQGRKPRPPKTAFTPHPAPWLPPAQPLCAQIQLQMIPTALCFQSHPTAGTPRLT